MHTSVIKCSPTAPTISDAQKNLTCLLFFSNSQSWPAPFPGHNDLIFPHRMFSEYSSPLPKQDLHIFSLLLAFHVALRACTTCIHAMLGLNEHSVASKN